MRKTAIDRAIEASEARIKSEQEVLERLKAAKQEEHAARLARKDAAAK